MLGNCFGWVTYSILIQDLFVFFGNAPGFCISFWLNLQAAKMQYETFRSNEWKALLVRTLGNENDEIDTPTTQRRQSTTEKTIEHVTPEPKVAPSPHERLVLLNVIVWLAIVIVIATEQSNYARVDCGHCR